MEKGEKREARDEMICSDNKVLLDFGEINLRAEGIVSCTDTNQSLTENDH